MEIHSVCVLAHVCVCVCVCVFLDSPLLCQPINEVCKLSSLKKHSVGHTITHTFIKSTHTHTHSLGIQSDYILFQANHAVKTFFSMTQLRSTTKCPICLFVVSVVCTSFVCVCVCVSESLFGQAVKDWFRVCCFEPTAKRCLTNPPCWKNKSFSRSTPTNHSSLFLCLASSFHDSLPLSFFSYLTLIYFSATSPFLQLCPSFLEWRMNAAQMRALHLLHWIIMFAFFFFDIVNKCSLPASLHFLCSMRQKK